MLVGTSVHSLDVTLPTCVIYGDIPPSLEVLARITRDIENSIVILEQSEKGTRV